MRIALKLLLAISLIIISFICSLSSANAAAINSIKVRNLDTTNERLIFNAKYNKTIKVIHNDTKVIIILKDPVKGKISAPKNSKYIKSIISKKNEIIITLKSNPGKVRKFLGDNAFGIEIIKTANIQKNADPKKQLDAAKKDTKSITKKEEKKVVKTEETKKVTPLDNGKLKQVETKKIETVKTETKTVKAVKSPKNPEPKKETPVPTLKSDQVLKLPSKDEAKKEEPAEKEEIVKAPITKVKEKITELNLIKFAQIGTDLELNFEWQNPVGAAIFKRSGYIYVVFDSNDNPPVMPKDAPIKLTSSAMGNYVYYKIPSNKNIKVARERSSWLITLTRDNVPKDAYEVGENQITPEFQISFTIPGLTNSVNIIDQDTGENFIVYTVNNDVINVEKNYHFTDFDLIRTVLGAALLKKNDNIKTSIKKNNLIIDSPSYKKTSMNYQTSDSMFNFGNWREPVPDYSKKLGKILYDLTKTDTKYKYIQRLRLADFYFQNGMTEEAEAVIENAIIYDPQIQKNIDLKIKMALLSFLNNKFVVAKNRFNELDMSKVHSKYHNELSMWIAAANLKVNDEYKDRRINYVINSEFFLKKYPLLVSSKLALIELEDMLDNEEYDAAANIIQHASMAMHSKYVNDFKYFQAMLAERNKNNKFAMKVLKDLSDDSGDLKNRAKAIFKIAQIEYEEKKIDATAALDKMEKALSIWRGDATEAEMLIGYGNLAYENGIYNKAFRAWQNVVENFIGIPEAIVLASDMSKKFVELFSQTELPKSINEMEYANLFFEFRELTPIGDKGDEIVRKMVNRLVDIDLLDQAQNILNHQIRFRSKGLERNNLIKQLAYLYLVDNKPKEAVEILALPLEIEPDFDESRKFKYLKATAYAENEKYDIALTMLKNDLSTNASGIRTDIYWRQRDWAAIKNELNLATEIWSESEGKIDQLQEKLIVKLAVAYEMLNDKGAILRLRKQFFMRFNDGNNKELLNYLCEEPIKADVRLIANNMDAKMLDNFASNYKDFISKNYNLSTAAY
mgnify:CR=1 FL=1